MASRCAIFVILTPMGPTQSEGVQMVRMPYLLTMVVDFTSETCLVVVIIPPYDGPPGGLPLAVVAAAMAPLLDMPYALNSRKAAAKSWLEMYV